MWYHFQTEFIPDGLLASDNDYPKCRTERTSRRSSPSSPQAFFLLTMIPHIVLESKRKNLFLSLTIISKFKRTLNALYF